MVVFEEWYLRLIFGFYVYICICAYVYLCIYKAYIYMWIYIKGINIINVVDDIEVDIGEDIVIVKSYYVIFEKY